MKTYKLIVHGRVQGVWYRKSVQKYARQMHVAGWVKNMPDKTVKVIVNLTDEQVERFIEKLYAGSPLSEVTKIEKEILEYTPFEIFEIRR